MLWFEGGVSQAVALCKDRLKIFVVFVEGDSEQSTEFANLISDSTIAKKLSDEQHFLAIKLKSGSVDYTHFAQIYQFVPVPSLFFIGRNGTPLEVICAGVDVSDLSSRIDTILKVHTHDVKENVANRSRNEQIERFVESETANRQVSDELAAASSSHKKPFETAASSSEPAAKVAKTEHHEVTKSGQEYDVVCDGDVCVRKPKTVENPGPSQSLVPPAKEPIRTKEPNETTSEPANEPQRSKPQKMEISNPIAGPVAQDSAAAASSISQEEQVKRAKQLIEARNMEKAQKDKELAKEKELERRATGQGVAELKRWQADQELKQIQEERKRERMENNLARQRILEQIAQDRAERRARDQPAPNPPASANVAANVGNLSGDNGTTARIQFKLPNGSSHTAQFSADDPLSEVQRYVANNLQLPFSSFTLWTAFPRRELVEAASSLRALELAPSAALLVLAKPSHRVLATPSAFSNLISFLTTMFTSLVLDPGHNLINWIRSHLFPPPGPAPSANPSTPPAAPSAPPRPSPPSPSPSPAPPSGVRYRPRTNIHRLNGDNPNDDDNNTWNGNSTQQM